MEIKAQFSHEQVRHDQDNDVHLVVTVTAPKSDWQAQRPSLCVIPVLDISGSMQGDKLAYAKQSILKLIEHLAPSDYCGVISFSNSARVDFEPKQMTADNKTALKAVVDKFHVEGGTNFSGGMLAGLAVANKMDLPEATIVRVIMFTDGQPTHGVTDAAGLCTLLDKQAGRASVSAFGYGEGANQDLLSQLSEKGKGNYAFVQNPDAALAAFGKELGGLLSMYAQNLRVEITPHNGHVLSEVLSDVEVEEENTGEIEIKVPQILSEEAMSLVLAVKLSQQKQAGPRQVNAVDVKLSFEVISKDGTIEHKVVETKGKVQFVKAGEEQKTPTKEVDVLVGRAQLVKAIEEAEKQAKVGNFAAAGLAFNGLNLHTRGLGDIAAVSDHVALNYSASKYASTSGNRVGLMRAMSRGAGTSALAKEDAAVLESANYVMSNSAQDDMSAMFKADPVTVQGVLPVNPGTAGAVPTSTITLTGPAPLAAAPLAAVPPLPTPTLVRPKTLSKSRSSRW